MGWSVGLAVVSGVLAAQFGHVVGVAPILAAILCGACFFRLRDVALIGFGAVLAHDVAGTLSAFTLVRLVGILGVIGVLRLVRVRPAPGPLALGLVLASPVYHVVLAVGDWVTQTCAKTPQTPAGLLQALAGSLLYFQRSFVVDVLVCGVFLSLYALAGYAVRLRWPAALPTRG